MKKVIIFFTLMTASLLSFAQETIFPFAPLNDSIPELYNFVENNDLSKNKGDTITLNVLYYKLSYFRTDEKTFGYIDSDLYATFSDFIFDIKEKKEVSKTVLYYLRDYKNKKPTLFSLQTEKDANNLLKKAKTTGEPFYFLRAEKFLIDVKQTNENEFIILKRINVPKLIQISTE